jgi:predicted pyridoxine 5'-phosphate oxidase superfamily flavin-nucleotide-binding protein
MLDFPRVDLEGIRAKLGEPDAPTTQKITDFTDANCLAFLAHSPFCTLATSDDEGNCDSSPRGDYPGFVACSTSARS